MNTFQLDDCLRDRDFAASCYRDRRLANTERFPQDLSTKKARRQGLQKDHMLLPRFFPGSRIFVTSDKRIVDDNINIWPDLHCGFIIVSDAKRRNTAGFRQFTEAIRQFKSSFPDWHSVSWRNSIVHITQESVAVQRVTGNKISDNQGWYYSQTGWQNQLREALATNASLSTHH